MKKSIYEMKYNCCGCSACYSICPMQAITMEADEEGFKYPHINYNICIECNKCETVCPLKNKHGDDVPVHIYAAKNKNEAVRRKSSSGGIFSLLADYVEEQNGVIYGAGFDKQFNVLHMRAETTEEWKNFCVSKYVQSDINNTFQQVCDDLNNGKTVIFSGTPCQIGGLKTYLSKVKVDDFNLITCDIVCHGTPSPKVWADYLEYLQSQNNGKINFVTFRNKEASGWHNGTFTIKDNQQNTILSELHRSNFFFQLFACHEILRPSCYHCQYTNFHRPGDITLGDFWGIESKFPQFDDDKGVSIVMVNTDIGKRIWKEIQCNTEYFEVMQEQCIQPNLQKPSVESPWRDSFWRWYKKYGLKRVGQKMGYLPMNKSEWILIFLYRCKEKLLSVLGK